MSSPQGGSRCEVSDLLLEVSALPFARQRPPIKPGRRMCHFKDDARFGALVIAAPPGELKLYGLSRPF